jgi:hypothetical protein
MPPGRERRLGVTDKARIGFGDTHRQLPGGQPHRDRSIVWALAQLARQGADLAHPRIGRRQPRLQHQIVISGDRRGASRRQ